MLSIDEIKKQYPNNFHFYNRGLLREYLQYNILAIIFSHEIGRKLSFLGGTNLRIVHGLRRFSEDIDFDNKDLSRGEFETLGRFVRRELEKLGFEVDVRFTQKEAFHCYIRFPKLLFEQGLSPFEKEKILIRVDTFDQGVFYKPEIYLLDKFDLFKQILITPKNVILAQKLWTITQRRRLKGRDFYDIMFLLQTTKPNSKFLEAKFGTSNLIKVTETLFGELYEVNFEDLAKDVQPFLIDENASDILSNFKMFLKQQLA
jgi:predicted nucleotidyltransferase component of viral defense system